MCIDPRRTETAEKCHHHLALTPGSDGALALAVMHELIVNDWLDHDYLARHVDGWDGLRERALAWTPERAAVECGLTADQIRDFARLYGTTKPGRDPPELRHAARARRRQRHAPDRAAALPDRRLAPSRRRHAAVVRRAGSRRSATRSSAMPDLLAGPQPRTVNMSTIGDDLLRQSGETLPDGRAFGPKIEALVVYNSNPVAVAPESRQVAAGFRREDLFTVVLEHFLTDTADHADYVLPATTQLEHWDVHASYGHTSLVINEPALTPRGQSRSNAAIFRALAQRMGFDEPCFADDDATLARQAVSGPVPFEQLRAVGWARCRCPRRRSPKAASPRPSGRAQCDVPGLGLPDYLPPYESVRSAPELARRFPLAMISPPARNFLNSTFVNVKSLRAIEQEPVLEIAAADAAARGIADGDEVRVFNDRGDYRCVARVSERARAGVVHGLGVWWRKYGLDGTNVNELTHQRLTDMGRAPSFYDCLVEVERADAAACDALWPKRRAARWGLASALSLAGAGAGGAGHGVRHVGLLLDRLPGPVGLGPPAPAGRGAAGEGRDRRPGDARGAAPAAGAHAAHARVRGDRAARARQRQLPLVRRPEAQRRGVERGGGAGAVAEAGHLVLPDRGLRGLPRLLRPGRAPTPRPRR